MSLNLDELESIQEVITSLSGLEPSTTMSLDVILTDCNGECMGVVAFDSTNDTYVLDTTLSGEVVTPSVS